MNELPRRWPCRGPGAALFAVLLVSGLSASGAAVATQPKPWWLSNPEALAFDPFSLETDPGLLSFYRSAFSPALVGGGTASRSREATTLAPRVPASAPTAGSAADSNTLSTGSDALTVVRHAFLIEPRLPKRTPVLPPWP